MGLTSLSHYADFTILHQAVVSIIIMNAVITLLACFLAVGLAVLPPTKRPGSGGCASTRFGCCPNDCPKAASGPFNKGCCNLPAIGRVLPPTLPPGTGACSATRFGCCPACPDAASGPKGLGCCIPPKVGK